MIDPVYKFVKGKGWIPTPSGIVLPVEQYLGTWSYEPKPGWLYPEVFRSAQLLNINGTDLIVGDFIPYGFDAWVITDIRDDGWAGVWHVTGEDKDEGKPGRYEVKLVSIRGEWEGVARL